MCENKANLSGWAGWVAASGRASPHDVLRRARTLSPRSGRGRLYEETPDGVTTSGAIVQNKMRATKVEFNRTDLRYRPGNAGRNPLRRLLSWASNKANWGWAEVTGNAW
jgi:hypothetical protein